MARAKKETKANGGDIKTPQEYLIDFVKYLNESRKFHPWTQKSLKLYADTLKTLAMEFYTEWEDPESKNSRILRASTLGYPSVVQAMKVLGYDKRIPHEGATNKLSRLFMQGHVFEAELIGHLAAYPDFKVRGMQQEVEFEGVLGHIDAIVDTPGGSIVIDAKTMSPYYYSKFVKSPDDVRGYVTQMAVYTECLDMPGALLVMDKATSEVSVVFIDEEDLEDASVRAHLMVPLLRKIEKFEDIFKVFQAPEPVEEVCKRKATGRFLVPEEMRYSPWRHIFYELETKRNCNSKYVDYVISVNSEVAAREKLDEMYPPDVN